MSEPRNDIDTLEYNVIHGTEGVEVDLGNGLVGLAMCMRGSSPGLRLFDVVWWVDGVRHSEQISEKELTTTTRRYLENVTHDMPVALVFCGQCGGYQSASGDTGVCAHSGEPTLRLSNIADKDCPMPYVKATDQ